MTALQFSPDGDIITGDMDGFLTIYTRSQDEPDGSTWFVSKEFKSHDVRSNTFTDYPKHYLVVHFNFVLQKHVTALYLLSEGTLLSAGGHDRNRQVKAWDALNRYKHITQSTVLLSIYFILNPYVHILDSSMRWPIFNSVDPAACWRSREHVSAEAGLGRWRHIHRNVQEHGHGRICPKEIQNIGSGTSWLSIDKPVLYRSGISRLVLVCKDFL